MPLYQMQGGGALGSLLRKIQEEKEQMPHRIPPSAEVVSPLRQMIVEPLKAPEAVGTAHMVGMKPEVSPASPVGPGGVTPARGVTPVAAVQPPRPVPTPAMPSAPAPGGAPSAPSPAPTPSPGVQGVSTPAPSLATQLRPASTGPTYSIPTSSGYASPWVTPAPSRTIQRLIVPGPTPTPEPLWKKIGRWVGYVA